VFGYWTLSKGGIELGESVVRAFEITSNTTTNLLYKKELNDIAEQLTKGEKISTHMNDKKKLFPLMVPQMLQVGESTGKMSETFLYLADIYEEEMDDLTKNLSTTVEPLLLIFMGLLVGFIAISIITPIYGITQHLTPK
jgi:type IV pilus assembly protein PilC